MTQHNPHPRRAIRTAIVLPLLGLLMGLNLTSELRADDHGDKATRKARELAAIRSAVERGQIVPLPRIMAIAQSKVPGDVVKTELEADETQLIYEVKILTRTAHIREVKLDARTGRILSVEDD